MISIARRVSGTVVLQRLGISRSGAIRRSRTPADAINHQLNEVTCSRTPVRFLSTPNNNKKEKQDSLKDAINRIQGDKKDGSSSSSSSDTSSASADDFLRKAADTFASFSEEVGNTWQELIGGGPKKSLNKKIGGDDDDGAGAEPYRGPLDIMVIDESENLTAWERMKKRLTEAPIISGILEKTEEVYEKSGAKNVKRKVDDLGEDAREAWETSQNPWVYRVSSVYDTLTAEHEQTVGIRELRELDPDFDLEVWQKMVVEDTLPDIMKLFLEGRINELQPWLGESVLNRIAAEIAARKQEGVEIDTHVLGIMNSEVLAVEPDPVEKGNSPIILLHFMCQQINCVRKKNDGSIVEGAEDDIRANSYVAAFQRFTNEEDGMLEWKIVDFRFNGAIAYL